MLVLRTVLSSAALAAALVLAASCASDGSGGPDPDGSRVSGAPTGGSWEEGDPVSGNWSILWKNLDPDHPASTVSIVNASSEYGQKLLHGASSSEIRVATDAQMGALLAELRKLGFFTYATDGVGLGNLPDVSGRKGVVIVTEEGRSKALMLTTGLGRSPVPAAYTNCKKFVVMAHGQLAGLETKATLGAPDERIFSVPRPTMKRP